MSKQPIFIGESYRGKHVLLTGGSGFIGKVWLAMALEMLPDVGRIYLLVRPGAQLSARERFEGMVNSSPVFRRLHEKYGKRLSRYLSERLEVVDGDLSKPQMGLSPGMQARLNRDIDLVIHCAGLVDFNPDLRKALAANVDTVVNVCEFIERCDHACLLHVSTSYVVGTRQGRVEETLSNGRCPRGEVLDPERELDEVRAVIQRVMDKQNSPEVQVEILEEVEALVGQRRGNGNGTRLVAAYSRRLSRERLRQAMVDLGKERARQWGWQNTYTYTKGLAESLLQKRFSSLRYAIVRPTIIESAVEFPFPGWNQGFNTSAPLAYLLGTWFHMLPSKADVPFDVVPVDMVCRAFTVIGAALLRNQHAPVYHIGTSDRNLFTLGRSCELTELGHRRHLRINGKNAVERVILSRWDAKPVDPDHILSAKNAQRFARGLNSLIDELPSRLRAKSQKYADKLKRAEKALGEIDDLVGIYQPFIHDYYQIFVCRAIDRHLPAEPEFCFEPETIDWRKYWLDVHMPGLRRWVFPQHEGKSRESFQPETPVSLVESHHAAKGGDAHPPRPAALTQSETF
jgi:long-chain acyl-CoA synthetase